MAGAIVTAIAMDKVVTDRAATGRAVMGRIAGNGGTIETIATTGTSGTIRTAGIAIVTATRRGSVPAAIASGRSPPNSPFRELVRSR